MFDVVFTNCRIFNDNKEADTIAVKEGRITYLGHGDIREAKQFIDLEGKTVLPGFIDSHTHLMNLGLSMTRLDLSKTKNREEALARTEEYASSSHSRVVVGYGWDETFWGDKDYINRKELDQIEKAVILYRKDMHMAVLNSSALKTLGIESSDGVVNEEKMGSLAPLTDPDMEETVKAVHAAANHAISQGITAVRDIMGSKVSTFLGSGEIPLRVFQLIYDNEYDGSQLSSSYSWGIKMFLDGSIGSRTAAHNGWDQNNLKFTHEELLSKLSNHWKNGIPVAMHAIGEIAVEQAVDALSGQKGSMRNSIEHFELVYPEILEKIGSSTIVSSQPNFLQWSQSGGLYDNTLGTEWFGKDNPFRNIIDTGVRLAFGSDCMPMGPSYGIGQAVNSPHSSQRISIEEAIKAYTSGGAYVIHEESLSGKLEIGFRADMTVFGPDYLEETRTIGEKEPLMTMIGGNIVHSTP